MDDNDKNCYYLRNMNIKKTHNKHLNDKNKNVKIKKNMTNDFSLASKQEIKKSETDIETLQKFELNEISSKNYANCHSTKDILMEDSEEPILNTSDKKNDISKNLQKGIKECKVKENNLNEIEISSLKNCIDEEEYFIEGMLKTTDELKKKIQTNYEILQNKKIPVNSKILKTNTKEVSLQKTKNDTTEHKIKIKRKCEMRTFVCPKKKIKESDNMKKVDIEQNDDGTLLKKVCEPKLETNSKVCNEIEQTCQEVEIGVIEKQDTCDIKNLDESKVSDVLINNDDQKKNEDKNVSVSNDHSNIWDIEKLAAPKESENMKKVDIELNDYGILSKKVCEPKPETNSKVCDETEQTCQEVEIGVTEKQDTCDIKNLEESKGKDVLINNDDKKENEDKNVSASNDHSNIWDIEKLAESKGSDVLITDIKKENDDENCSVSNDFSNIFDIKIPLIGKKVIQNDDEPFVFRYDLAIEKNKKRFRFQKQELLNFKNADLKPWEIEANKSEKEKKHDANKKKHENLGMAINVTKICMQILELLNNDSINEREIGKLFVRFLCAPLTPTSLLFVPHFVHTMSFIRGCKCFSKQLRLLANDCYQKCHAMFPVPLGYNFETVYSAEVQRLSLPDSFDRLENIPLDYGDTSDIDECSDEEEV